jgi:hypothetical protein
MDTPTYLLSTQMPDNTPLEGGAKSRPGHILRGVGFAVWGLGMMLFVVSCFLIRAHPQPYPLDIATTQVLQHLQDVSWAASVLHFVGAAIDPLVSALALTLWFAVLLLAGWVSRLRGRTAMRWWVSAGFLAVLGAGTFGLNQLIDHLVNRPRPSSDTAPIRHHINVIPIPTYSCIAGHSTGWQNGMRKNG